ncbi:formin-J [Drosophila tropicalis]|uniref:formin-J n=1 Tax=Drosophila tropicalis TaxID=46794 RepID=UPI0035ABD8B7
MNSRLGNDKADGNETPTATSATSLATAGCHRFPTIRNRLSDVAVAAAAATSAWSSSSRLCLWLSVSLSVGLISAQSSEHFEDADKLNEYTDQEFDLRHTIPGEPGVDYPILSALPKTSFVCQGRHEGYYADVESRCQAFRICAHTARSPQGFGFLCPNGTLFSQQHFVCDWYRNVNCDESEQYYQMNDEKKVGSTHEMMERVRQMMEYPMKTISKALQQTATSQQSKPTTKRKQLSEVSTVGEATSTRGEAIKSEPLGTVADIDGGDDIYVNSLGELSSDPGIQFDHTNAHIIAEYPREYHYQKQQNFAERVNAGLEIDSTDASSSNEVMAPDYIKHIRNTKDEATQMDLVSNINNLLDEVSTDLDPSVSGYQAMSPAMKVKQPFRFLSRGFSMNSDKSKNSAYVYNRPKQTAGTVRFTPNEIPNEAQKDLDHKVKFPKTTTESIAGEMAEPLLIAPTLSPSLEDEQETTVATTEAGTSTGAPLIDQPLGLLAPPEIEIESLGQAAALTANLPLADDLSPPELNAEAIEKTDAHHQAAKLLLAGVKLSSHNDETETALRTNKLAHGRSEPQRTTTTTSTPLPTPVMSTSTETVTEISSTQERIRGYRRFAQQRVGGATGVGATSVRRPSVRPLPLVINRSSTTSTTQRTTTPTRSYIERLAASRLRFSRLHTAKPTTLTIPAASSTTTTTTTTTTTVSPLSHVRGGVDQGPSKKLAVRNIEKETGNEPPVKASWESVHSNLQRFQVQRGNRVYTPATRAAAAVRSTTEAVNHIATTKTSSVNVNRGRNRYSSYKAPVQRTRGTTTQRTTTTARTTTPPPPTTPAALSTLSQQISALASSYNQGYSYTPVPSFNTPFRQTNTNTNNININSNTPIHTPSSSLSTSSASSSSATSSSSSSAFLPFDKLTRAIVDESILQNFKSTQQKVTQSQQQQQQQQQQRVIKPSYVKPATAPAIASLTVPPRPQQLPTPPGIVIARAEGQRIAPNSASNIISSLASQPQTQQTSQSQSYVSLNEFLNNKFGQTQAEASTLQQQQQPQQRQPQQQQRVQQQHTQRQQVQQQHIQHVQQQQHPIHQQQLSYISQQYQPQQQQQQQIVYQQYQQQPQTYQQQFHHQQQHPQQSASILTNQQPYLTPNIFVPYQQQQQQLPQFPPLAQPLGPAASSPKATILSSRQGDHHLNVQLPALPNGLIPAPNSLQLAQKRSDVSANQLQLTNSNPSRERSFYAGRTSYDVPQSSVGRLSNDITHLRRRLRRY